MIYFFLEQLENKGVKFMTEFLEEPIEKFAIDKVNSEQKKRIICEVEKEVFSEAYGEILYNIRYSKKDEIRFRKNLEPNATYYNNMSGL